MIEKKEIQRPFFYENEKSKTIVIFIHGILEGPNQFKIFANIVNKKGFSFSAILLDGHGKSGTDFANSNIDKWIESVDKEIQKYKNNYENIILVGHSMGGLLSILLSEEYKEKVKGIMLISTPFKVFVKFNMIISSIKIGLGIVRKDDILTSYAYNAFSVKRCSLGTYIRWIPRYIDLFKLISLGRKMIEDINVPTLFIHTYNDELVNNKSLDIFNKKIRTDYKIVHLKNSGHFYYDEYELKNILNEFDLFLDNLIN